MYGNPHSRSHSSERTTNFVDKARNQVLELFNTTNEEYDVVFTQNTTAAVKLVAEGFTSTYGRHWNYVYSEDSHTSLIGLRELAHDHGVFSDATYASKLEELNTTSAPLLVSWPAQSNFSGARFLDKDWHLQAKEQGDHVFTLLDVASLVTTHIPDLSTPESNHLAADFLCMSFYKMFGFPDLGALLIKKGSQASSIFERRAYFGGGTVESLTINQKFAPRKASLPERLEDGTVPFHSIIALSLAIDTHKFLYTSFSKISQHVSALANYTFHQLKELKFSNGQHLCELYTNGDYLDGEKQGPIVTFNLRDYDGSWIGYSRFEEMAFIEKINIRTGTMCNTGGSARDVGYTEEDVILNHHLGHVCGDDMDVVHGKPTGAIRVSLGAMSSVEDVEALISCLKKYILNSPSQEWSMSMHKNTFALPHIKSILIYPIKSCGAFSVPSSVPWTLRPEGLEWDREFCVVSTSNGNVLSLKKFTEMANIKPVLNLEEKIMTVSYEGSLQLKCKSTIVVSLSATVQDCLPKREMNSRLCGEKIQTSTLNSPEVVDFFSEILQVPCTLARSACNNRFYKPHLDGPLDFQTQKSDATVTEKKIKISMTNSSPLLLLSDSSVRELNRHRESGATRDINSAVFRGNIIIDGSNLSPYSEDSWADIQIGENDSVYNVSLWLCHFCEFMF